ncbi:MAG: tetratricopeptide repeat protein [Candidatus Scalinduaceae bacterium]
MKALRIAIFFMIPSFLLSELCIAQKAEDYFRRGTGYLETRLIDKAIVEYKKALPLLKEDQSQLKAEIYSALANAYNWKGIYKAAITACKKAIEINPDLANAHYNLGFAYREEKKKKLAEKEFALYEKLLKQQGEYIKIPEKPTSEDINKYVRLGDNYFKEGKFDEAISEYKKALEIKSNEGILNKLGNAYKRKRLKNKSTGKTAREPLKEQRKSTETDLVADEKYLNSMPELGEATEVAPDTSMADSLAEGILYYNKGMLDKAIEEFKEVIEIDPEDVNAYYNLGNAYVDKGMFNEAISAYKRAIEINPEFIDAYLNLGMIYLNKDLTDEVISLYKQALKHSPNDTFLYYHLGEAYAYKERYQKAITEFKKAISINPMDPDSQYRLAEMYYETKQFDLALKHIRRAEELGYSVEQDFINNLKKETQ